MLTASFFVVFCFTLLFFFNNDLKTLGWSVEYALGLFGSLVLIVAVIIFIVQSIEFRKRKDSYIFVGRFEISCTGFDVDDFRKVLIQTGCNFSKETPDKILAHGVVQETLLAQKHSISTLVNIEATILPNQTIAKIKFWDPRRENSFDGPQSAFKLSQKIISAFPTSVQWAEIKTHN